MLIKGVAVIDGVCQGYVLFKQEDAKSATVEESQIFLSSLHGFHIHQSGDLGSCEVYVHILIHLGQNMVQK